MNFLNKYGRLDFLSLKLWQIVRRLSLHHNSLFLTIGLFGNGRVATHGKLWGPI